MPVSSINMQFTDVVKVVSDDIPEFVAMTTGTVFDEPTRTGR